jgi:DNA-binding beta-propeller fold protein YncE
LWTKRYNGPGNSIDSASRVVASPDGTKIYVTGQSAGATSDSDYATIAYNATTAAVVWTKRYNGPANGADAASAIAVSPDGTKLYVTGRSTGSTSDSDYATIAYNATTGAVVWTTRYNGLSNNYDAARTVAVSPDGTKVYVSGESIGSTGDWDYATVAYNAMTGAVVWTKRYNGTTDSTDAAYAVTVSPDSTKVYVTGLSFGSTGSDYATIAYNAATGAVVWTKRYNGTGNGEDYASAVAVSPDGTKVYVTGRSVGSTTDSDYATIAYNATTGTVVWAKRYNGPANSGDYASAVVVSPDSTKVFVTGDSLGSTANCTCYDYATVAYSATSGAVVWAKRYNGPANRDDDASAVAVSPDGNKVYVTGQSGGSTGKYDYATVAYNALSGAVVWAQRYNGPGDDDASAVTVSPDGTKVCVTGQSIGSTTNFDYVTIAYSAT